VTQGGVKMLNFLILVVGLILLVKCADVFVESSSKIARVLGIPALVIGLTIVAFGTSAPEAAVSLTAVIKGSNEISVGNVVGSNICNILIVLGCSALFTSVFVPKSTLKKEFPILIAVTAILVLFGCTFNLGGSKAILRWEGIILVILIVAYITFLVIDAIRHPQEEEVEVDENGNTVKKDDGIKDMNIWLAILLVIVGAAGVVLGGEMVVFGAKHFALTCAEAAGVDNDLAESLVGLTVVAVGTSLPELVTSVVASKKGQNEMALGNVIGSNSSKSFGNKVIVSTLFELTS
jgi:cation:H+ antiporter